MQTDRGQTPHDFALGVGVFLLTVAFVFATLPTLAEPFEGRPTDAVAVHAERVAATTIHHLSVEGDPARLDPEQTAAFFRENSSGSALREFVGLPDHAVANVTILNGSRVVHLTDADGVDVALAAGEPHAGRRAATTVRVVTFAGADACRPACRLVVRIW